MSAAQRKQYYYELSKLSSSVWEPILSMKALSKAMLRKYGADWKYEVVTTYGPKQLGLV